MRPPRSGRAFLRLWTAHAVSEFGSQVTLVALPLAAVLMLDAGPQQVGLLMAAEVLPFPVLALWVGVWVDRLRRRRLLIIADWARAALLASIPLAAAFGALSMPQLYIVALAAGCFTVLFDISYTSYVPQIVPAARLVAANSRLSIARSGAQLAGPGIGGVLVQVMTAPIAVVCDAVSFVVSALLINGIRDDARACAVPAQRRRHVWGDIVEGLRFVRRTKVLAVSALAMSLVNLFDFVILAVYTLYVTQELGIGPAVYGMVLLVGGIGAIIGALLAGSLAHRLGIGPAAIVGVALFGVAPVLFPLAHGPRPVEAAMLMTGQLLATVGLAVLEVNLLSLRQAITPSTMQGRVGATLRMANWAMKPIGAVLGGLLGGAIGLRGTLWIAVIGGAAGTLWMWLSPLRHVRAVGDPAPAEHAR